MIMHLLAPKGSSVNDFIPRSISPSSTLRLTVQCSSDVSTMLSLCKRLGILIASDKLEGPGASIFGGYPRVHVPAGVISAAS